MRRTGLAWSPAFSSWAPEPAAAFLPCHPLLPDSPWDSAGQIQCLRDVVDRTDLSKILAPVPFVAVSAGELLEVHDEQYVQTILDGCEVGNSSKVQSALLAAGAARALVEAVWSGAVDNGYALVRPAGHHATRAVAMGGCVFASGVLAARTALRLGAQRIMYLDWDAHRGNAQQEAFYDDPRVLTISIHQGSKYPPGTGGTDARGQDAGWGYNLNVPLPPGAGGGVYRAVLERIVQPAAARFRPDFVLVSSGLDGNYIDPSARLRLHSRDYARLTQSVMGIADEYGEGRLVMCHEGGYAPVYTPICLLRILETMSEFDCQVEDPFLAYWGEDFADDVSSEAERVISEVEQ